MKGKGVGGQRCQKMSKGTYFFGSPIRRRKPSAEGHRRVFVLGAYPSALHVRWTLPLGVRRPSGATHVSAVAVADEPTPFWDGADAQERTSAWMASKPSHWGAFENDPSRNGPSGKKLTADYLDVLQFSRTDCWITDCLDHYFGSKNQHKNLPFYRSLVPTLGLPEVHLPPHPTENEIRRLAEDHLTRLDQELGDCDPEEVLTLGNAALAVFLNLVEAPSNAPTMLNLKVAADGSGPYGNPVAVRHRGKALRWWPLAHMAAPSRYHKAHNMWIERQR